jgi:hypothetical protein
MEESEDSFLLLSFSFSTASLVLAGGRGAGESKSDKDEESLSSNSCNAATLAGYFVFFFLLAAGSFLISTGLQALLVGFFGSSGF